MKVPAVLLQGDPKKVEDWRFEQSLARTKERRPDLFKED
jgi:tRNA (guanine37-N1)-methyltransferase